MKKIEARHAESDDVAEREYRARRRMEEADRLAERIVRGQRSAGELVREGFYFGVGLLCLSILVGLAGALLFEITTASR